MPFYRRFHATRDFTLNDAARHYGVPITGRYQHSALVDAEILAEVFIALAKDVNSRKLATLPSNAPLGNEARILFS